MAQKLLCTEKGLEKLREVLGRDVASRAIKVAGKPMFEVIPAHEKLLNEAHTTALKALGIMVVED